MIKPMGFGFLNQNPPCSVLFAPSPIDLSYLSDSDSYPQFCKYLGPQLQLKVEATCTCFLNCLNGHWSASGRIIRPLQNLQTGKQVRVINDGIGLSETSSIPL